MPPGPASNASKQNAIFPSSMDWLLTQEPLNSNLLSQDSYGFRKISAKFDTPAAPSGDDDSACADRLRYGRTRAELPYRNRKCYKANIDFWYGELRYCFAD